MPINGQNRRKQALSGYTITTKIRNIPPPILEPREIRAWGKHLVQGYNGNSYRCTLCDAKATGNANIRALAKSPCWGKIGAKPGKRSPENQNLERGPAHQVEATAPQGTGGP
eukprot:10316755-Heterocapsa_arctica.AAC.1